MRRRARGSPKTIPACVDRDIDDHEGLADASTMSPVRPSLGAAAPDQDRSDRSRNGIAGRENGAHLAPPGAQAAQRVRTIDHLMRRPRHAIVAALITRAGDAAAAENDGAAGTPPSQDTAPALRALETVRARRGARRPATSGIRRAGEPPCRYTRLRTHGSRWVPGPPGRARDAGETLPLVFAFLRRFCSGPLVAPVIAAAAETGADAAPRCT